MKRSIQALLLSLVIGWILMMFYSGVFAIIVVISIMGAFLIEQIDSQR